MNNLDNRIYTATGRPLPWTADEIMKLPIGHAERWIRQNVDPDWGMDRDGKKKYEVCVEVVKTTYETHEVWAENEDDAKKIALKNENDAHCYSENADICVHDVRLAGEED